MGWFRLDVGAIWCARTIDVVWIQLGCKFMPAVILLFIKNHMCLFSLPHRLWSLLHISLHTVLRWQHMRISCLQNRWLIITRKLYWHGLQFTACVFAWMLILFFLSDFRNIYYLTLRIVSTYSLSTTKRERLA